MRAPGTFPLLRRIKARLRSHRIFISHNINVHLLSPSWIAMDCV